MPPKKSTEPKKIRFLNMSPKQVRRRYQRVKRDNIERLRYRASLVAYPLVGTLLGKHGRAVD